MLESWIFLILLKNRISSFIHSGLGSKILRVQNTGIFSFVVSFYNFCRNIFYLKKFFISEKCYSKSGLFASPDPGKNQFTQFSLMKCLFFIIQTSIIWYFGLFEHQINSLECRNNYAHELSYRINFTAINFINMNIFYK